MSAITVDGRTTLALGPEIAEKLTAALASYGDPPERAFANVPGIVSAALEGSPEESRESNSRTILDFLRGEMLRRGFPADADSLDILARKAAVDARNAETGAETEELILRQEYEAHYVQVDAARSPSEESAYRFRLADLRSKAERLGLSPAALENGFRERMQGH